MYNTVRDTRIKKNYTMVLPIDLIDALQKASIVTGIRITHIAEKAFVEYLQKIDPESDNVQKSEK